MTGRFLGRKLRRKAWAREEDGQHRDARARGSSRESNKHQHSADWATVQTNPEKPWEGGWKGCAGLGNKWPESFMVIVLPGSS
jgi:hypothetical protein